MLDGDADLPQNLLIDLADRRSEDGNGGGGIEIKDTKKILMLKAFIGLHAAA